MPVVMPSLENVYACQGGLDRNVRKCVLREGLVRTVWSSVCVRMTHTVIRRMDGVHVKLDTLVSYVTEHVRPAAGVKAVKRNVTAITAQSVIIKQAIAYVHLDGSVSLVRINASTKHTDLGVRKSVNATIMPPVTMCLVCVFAHPAGEDDSVTRAAQWDSLVRTAKASAVVQMAPYVIT